MNVERLRELLQYDLTTGKITWKKRWSNAIKADLSAGHICPQGYLSIMVDGKNVKGHRIAWAIHHGVLPSGNIDHINHDRADNRIANLRIADYAENQKNKSLDRRNTSGVTGVRWRSDRGAWESSIRVSSKLFNLGLFADFEAAVATRRKAEQTYGFHPNHGKAA